MKLLYCGHCGDVVRLFPEKRSCKCGKSWGQYLEDKATTVQTYPGLSLGISNPDFEMALNAFVENPNYFSPILAIRMWVNPLSEPDVKFVAGEELAAVLDKRAAEGKSEPDVKVVSGEAATEEGEAEALDGQEKETLEEVAQIAEVPAGEAEDSRSQSG